MCGLWGEEGEERARWRTGQSGVDRALNGWGVMNNRSFVIYFDLAQCDGADAAGRTDLSRVLGRFRGCVDCRPVACLVARGIDSVLLSCAASSTHLVRMRRLL